MKIPPLFHYQTHDTALAAELVAMGERVGKPYFALLPAGLLVALGWRIVPLHVICGWLALVLAVAAFGRWYNGRYRGLEPGASLEEVRRAEWIALLYSVCLGTAWGLSSQFMVAGEITHNFLVVILYFAVAAAGCAIAIFNRARMLASIVFGTVAFLLPLPRVFPQDWLWLVPLILLYNSIIGTTTRERTLIVIANLLLRNEKQRLLDLQRAETARANEANQEKSAFLAAASHDLRQPLHAMMLTSHALSLGVPPEEGRVLIERILEAGHALSEQFNLLMDLSRLESGTYRLNPGSAAVTALLQRVVAAHRQTAEDKGIRLRLRVDRHLRTLALAIDVGLLGRVLDNLVNNAIKFSGAGAGVLLTARRRGGLVMLEVLDQGVGIAPEQQAQVFKPYVQLNNPARDMRQGIGLGLSIVQQAAALLGGALSLDSTPGRGSRFGLALSRALLQAIPETAPAPAPLPTQLLNGKRLLIVEDDPMAASALVAWAANWGLQSVQCSDPRALPEMPPPDLILCDIRLPGERDGIHWMTDWLGQWPEARGLLLSGELSAETHQRAEAEGLLLLTKPVRPDFLLQTLTGMLGAHGPSTGG